MSSIKHFFKSSIVYFIGNVLTKIMSFFLLPLYTYRISTEAMGYYDLSTSYLNILIPVICMEIWTSIMRYMFDYYEIRGKYKAIFNGLLIFGGSVVLYTLLLGLNMTLNSLYIAMIIGLVVQILILEGRIHLFRHLSVQLFDWELLKSMLRYSIPLSVNSACFWFLTS